MKVRKKYEINNIKEISIRDLIDLGCNTDLYGNSIEDRLNILIHENEHLKEIIAKLIERLHLDDKSIMQITGCNHSYELADNDIELNFE
jgi:hypothetical protein